MTQAPHRRYNPLKGEWVLVSPHRNQRPWQGKSEQPTDIARPSYDPTCYLCPGNTRANGEKNPDYKGVYVFRNDFPAMRPDDRSDARVDDPLFSQQSVRGEARVICFSERHDLTFSGLDAAGREAVVRAWIDQHVELADRYGWVAIFENKGTAMGCSNPHPHGQIWASDHVPNEVAAEDRQQRRYLETHGRALLLDYALAEQERGERVVAQAGDWLAVVPWWAVWPFETLVLPLKPLQRLKTMSPDDIASLALILGDLTKRYDNLFETDFPYSMGWHGALPSAGHQPHWQLHAHFYPPLLRSATVRKFMVGYEMLGEPQRDLTAELAAERLRTQSGKRVMWREAADR